ncbi:MAG: hypothetical protein J6N21_12900 [Butyrivibrio sp.]|nr:hypothetical protein [Butyrivibrio sp.]
MRVVVSIPVHENIKVIANQIENFKCFIEGVYIVLHVSQSFDKYDDLVSLFHKDRHVIINPIRLKTQWGDIVEPHISNYKYVSQVMEFDYFVLHASNDMYIKSGFKEYIQNYDAGFNIRKIVNKDSHWWPGNAAQKDGYLHRIMNRCGQTMIIATQVESSFYKKEIMAKIVETIDSVERKPEDNLVYTREEIFFSTIASNYVDWSRIGKITTFSEVHRFDRIVWKVRDITRLIYRVLGRFFISQEQYYRFEEKCNDFLFKSGFYKTSVSTVKRILHGDKKYIKHNSFLNDGSGTFQLYEDYIFSVKRVERIIDDKLRKYITRIGKYEETIRD